MTLEKIVELMYENEKAQKICVEDNLENVLYTGTVKALRVNFPKSLKAEISTMYTENHGLTVIIK